MPRLFLPALRRPDNTCTATARIHSSPSRDSSPCYVVLCIHLGAFCWCLVRTPACVTVSRSCLFSQKQTWRPQARSTGQHHFLWRLRQGMRASCGYCLRRMRTRRYARPIPDGRARTALLNGEHLRLGLGLWVVSPAAPLTRSQPALSTPTARDSRTHQGGRPSIWDYFLDRRRPIGSHGSR